MGKDRRTIKTYINRWEFDVAKFKAEAVRCTRQLDICRFHVRYMARFKKVRV
jgi:hypothetical protein